MLNGSVDVVRRGIVSGWAADSDEPDQVIEILVYVDGAERGRYPADRPRRDLRGLAIYGDGSHGFTIDLAPFLVTDEDHEIVLRPLAGWVPLRHGHFRIAKNSAGVECITDLEEELPPAQSTGSRTPRYVLHIGLHKTGTTYLQSAFFESRNELRANGILYPDATFGWIKPGGNSHTELHSALATLEGVSLAAGFARLNASSYNTILISSEDLGGISRQSLRLLRSLTAGRPIDIVCYCRRWSELLPAFWQERVKQGKVETLAEFLSAQMADPMKSSVINFDIMLSKFVEIFGIESIKLISYNHLVDSKIDLYDHFVRSVLMSDRAPSITRVTPNKSLGPVDIEAVRLLNAFASMRSMPAGIDIFHQYLCHRSDTDASLVHEAMAKNLGSIRLSDAAVALRAVHDLIFEKYGSRMVDPNSGYNLFLPAVREIQFVKPDYLLAEGVLQSAVNLYQKLII